MRNRIYSALKGAIKEGKLEELIGCSIEELKSHLESQFHEGMSWENYGEWHVDHRKPCDSFNLTMKEEQLKCFHYSNLQPLWEEENLQKNASFDEGSFDHVWTGSGWVKK